MGLSVGVFVIIVFIIIVVIYRARAHRRNDQDYEQLPGVDELSVSVGTYKYKRALQ